MKELEKEEGQYLAPYAMLSSQTRGRKYPEEKSKSRTEFQRDRDRIIHCSAFRRMEYKTQVFVNHEGDHYRTRLTHSLEVSQIARSVARRLRINEDLTEALVLAHDLGHTPFGHSGERVMSALMKEHGGFEHNNQSLRVVDFLERRYPQIPGLNLTFEVREGITKHSAHWDPNKVPEELHPKEQPVLEAQMIDYVDEIAYNNHDIDDGLFSHLIRIEDLEKVTLWREATKAVKKNYPGAKYPETKYVSISAMITLLAEDLIAETEKKVSESGAKSVDDIRKVKRTVAGFSKEMAEMNQELKKFLWNNMYTHHRVVRMEEKAKRILTSLFNAYMARPQQIPVEFRETFKDEPTPRMICDYIAGMTDRFALDEYEKFFDPHTRV